MATVLKKRYTNGKKTRTSAKKTTKTPKKAPKPSGKGAAARKKPVIGIVYGSSSDEPVVAECARILERFAIPYERKLLSAHRMPKATHAYGTTARDRGLKVIIAMAGMAAHLPGVMASLTTLPVLGVPLAGPHIDGTDALLSIVQMPAGVPVGCTAIGKAGAKNAALLAARFLALNDGKLAGRLDDLSAEMERGGRV